MTVGLLLSLRPGSVVSSKTRPGDRILLFSGRVQLASADPLVQDGQLILKIEDTSVGEG